LEGPDFGNSFNKYTCWEQRVITTIKRTCRQCRQR